MTVWGGGGGDSRLALDLSPEGLGSNWVLRGPRAVWATASCVAPVKAGGLEAFAPFAVNWQLLSF